MPASRHCPTRQPLLLLAAAVVRCIRPRRLQGNAASHGPVPLQTGGPCDPAQRRRSSCGKQLHGRPLAPAQGPRWKKGKDGKDFAALAAEKPMSSIVAELQASLRDSEAVATLAAHTRDAILMVGRRQAKLLNCASFGRAVSSAGTGAAERHWFQLGPEEVFFLCHALKCVTVESEKKARIGAPELWDLLASTSERFPEIYKAYQHLRLKNWVVKSGLQYGAEFVAYRHHPALVHSEFAVTVVPEGKAFGTRCSRMKVWSELLCALRASGSVAKTVLVLTISTKSSELGSLDCLEQMIVHERMITRWIPQQCRACGQQDKPSREETSRDGQRQKFCREVTSNEEQEHASGGVVFSYWGVVLSFTILCSLLVYKLKS